MAEQWELFSLPFQGRKRLAIYGAGINRLFDPAPQKHMKRTQQQRILQELQKGKLNSFYATYEMHIKQAPTRIKELKEQGYFIASNERNDRSVDWELIAEPKKERKPISYRFEGTTAYPIYADSIKDSGEPGLQPTQSYLF